MTAYRQTLQGRMGSCSKCGLMEGIEVIPAEEMVAKIMAAVDTIVDGDMVVMVRTDACKVYGLDEAITVPIGTGKWGLI